MLYFVRSSAVVSSLLTITFVCFPPDKSSYATEIVAKKEVQQDPVSLKYQSDDENSRNTVALKTEEVKFPTNKKDSGTVITLLLAGDTGFNQSRQKVLSDGVKKFGKLQPFKNTLSKFIDDITGDINFANVETVVTDKNSIKPRGEYDRYSFYFRSHPNGFRFLSQSGFNLFSLANNHSLDFGREGIRETLRHFGKLKSRYNIAYSGIGLNKEQAGAPANLRVKDTNFALSSISFVTSGAIRFRADRTNPGQLSYHSKADLDETVNRLSAQDSDFRILSIHYGRERYPRVSKNQIRKWRQKFIKNNDIQMIVAHHSHVAQGIEITDGKLIFYGLGNFLHHGMANMSSQGICRDYGLVAKVYLLKDKSGSVSVRAVEAIPVSDMHIQPTRFASIKESHLRIEALNHLSDALSSPEENSFGLRFTLQPDGSGLYCRPGAQVDPNPISNLCRGWSTPKRPPISVRKRIKHACADRSWSRYDKKTSI